ncbi:hypothetical protein FA95DRAFT_650714 [Auriscalpium vulgare]|uniref:Uncharacterized protein n=1 Tax=Auriscalpium vulgare TaxID=40419 RepID=A0ACB8RDX4_9AGAM|nr:hypothetical protein FA95DRAFT_650714 [Auriscalpium vulgare]
MGVNIEGYSYLWCRSRRRKWGNMYSMSVVAVALTIRSFDSWGRLWQAIAVPLALSQGQASPVSPQLGGKRGGGVGESALVGVGALVGGGAGRVVAAWGAGMAGHGRVRRWTSGGGVSWWSSMEWRGWVELTRCASRY